MGPGRASSIDFNDFIPKIWHHLVLVHKCHFCQRKSSRHMCAHFGDFFHLLCILWNGFQYVHSVVKVLPSTIEELEEFCHWRSRPIVIIQVKGGAIFSAASLSSSQPRFSYNNSCCCSAASDSHDKVTPSPPTVFSAEKRQLFAKIINSWWAWPFFHFQFGEMLITIIKAGLISWSFLSPPPRVNWQLAG